MFKTGAYIPEQPPVGCSDCKAAFDRLYLEKCREVNELERNVETFKSMAEVALKQKREIAKQLEESREQLEKFRQVLADSEALAAVRDTAEDIKAMWQQFKTGFISGIEPPEELPEELAESVPLWASQAVSSQDILCLSSALKNLYEIHKTDGWLLYNRLAKVLEQKIEEYCKEEG